MPVFISHRSLDDTKAQEIADRLSGVHRIRCYLDHIDTALQGAARITSLLVGRINECSHLIALITPTVVLPESWWVPFEIGVARQADRRIASFSSDMGYERLPQYLKEWPVLIGPAAIDEFAELYHLDNAGKPLVDKFVRSNKPRISTASEFHIRLKRALGQ